MRRWMGFGQDELPPCSEAAPDEPCVCPGGTFPGPAGGCISPPQLCGAGTAWSEDDQACTAIFVPKTGGGGTKPGKANTTTITGVRKASLASMLSSETGLWVVGGVVAGMALLALLGKGRKDTQ